METVRIDNAAEFDSFVRAHERCHMMQTSAWGLVKKEWSWTGFICRDESGNIKGTCGVIIRKMPMMPFKMMYAPRGPVCDLDDEETVNALLSAICEFGRKNGAYTFKIDTDTPVTNTKYIDLLKKRGFVFKEANKDFNTIQSRYIFRLNIAEKSEDDIMASFHPKTRYNTRLAVRKGITVEVKGKEACKDFHKLMVITGERDAFATRDISYFERIFDAFGDDAKIAFAYLDGTPVAGILNIFCGDKEWYVYGASSNEYRNYMPTYLLQWEMIKHAINHGCRYYDLRGGYPDEKNPLHGIFKFKKGFCPEYTEFMGEADLILDKKGYVAVEAAQKLVKSTRKLRAKLFKHK